MKPRTRSVVQRFEDLRVWQAGRELVKGVYRASRTQAVRGDRGLVDQMTRTAVSVTSNTAEGFERGSRVQNLEFCFYAKGSVGELLSQAINAHDVGLLDDAAFGWLHAKCEEVSSLLAGFVKHLAETAGKIPGMRFTCETNRKWGTIDDWLAGHGIRRLPDGRCVSIANQDWETQNRQEYDNNEDRNEKDTGA